MKVHTCSSSETAIPQGGTNANAVSVRVHGQGNLGARPRDEAIAAILEVRNARS